VRIGRTVHGQPAAWADDPEFSLVIKDLTFPNGIAFSPDEKTLYVAVSDPKHTTPETTPMPVMDPPPGMDLRGSSTSCA